MAAQWPAMRNRPKTYAEGVSDAGFLRRRDRSRTTT
jgi:hypothetical protein